MAERPPGPTGPVPALAAGLTLALSLAATALAWRATQAAVDQKLQDNFEYRIRDAERRIASRIGDCELALRGVAALFATSDSVDRRTFARFVGALELQRSIPGLQAVGFQRLLPAAELAAHQAEVRREGFPEYEVRPTGARPEVAPVVYVEPYTRANQRVIGFDPLSEPHRRAALDRARDTGAAVLSGKITLVQDAGADPAPGALLYLPVYRPGAPIATVEARRAALVGWLYLAFRVRELMDGLLGERGPDLDLELYDGAEPSAEGQLYDANGEPFALRPARAAYESTRALPLAGTVWTVAIRSTGRIEPRLGADRPRLVAAAGAAISLLLALVALLLLRERARVREALRHSESLYQTLARSFPNGVVGLFDRDLRFQVMNGSVLISDADPQALVGKTLAEAAPPALLHVLEPAYRAALGGASVTVETEHQGRATEVRLRPVPDAAGQVTMGMLMTQDVTERRRAVADLQAAAAYARGLIEASLDPLFVVGLDGRITDVNAAAVSATGRSRGALVGSTFEGQFTEPERARAGYQQVLADGAVRDYPLQLHHAMGRVAEVVFSATVYRDPRGALQGVLAVARDLTELRALQSRLALASRLAALGTVVAGVAHQINNPLAVELSDQEVALENLRRVRASLRAGTPAGVAVAEAEGEALDEAIEALEEAQSAGQRVARIVQDMRALATPGQGRTRVRLAEVVAEALRRLPPAREGTGDLEVQDQGAPDVLAAPDQLQEVIVNLIANAEKASGERRDGIVLRLGPGGPGMARLEVRDQGVGIPLEHLDQIFDPFFTTRPVGEGRGTGLGLSICHAILVAHGGSLTVESEVGKGSTFQLELPAAPASA